MALANFIDKINLGASQILKTYDRSTFTDKLLSNCIGIRYSTGTIQSYEGRVILNLLNCLLARLYPNLKYTVTDGAADTDNFIEQLKKQAREINPVINLEENQEETFMVQVGESTAASTSYRTFYIGSDNWKGCFSIDTPQSIGNSKNPFGAASSACILSSNLFRAIFNDELGKPALDENLTFSAYSQTVGSAEKEPELPESISIDFTLFGAGAIGNAALWTLLQLSGIEGRVSLIDHDTVSLSNLQRYIMMGQEQVDHLKVNVIKEIFGSHSSLVIQPYPNLWQEIAGTLDRDQLQLVATALDTSADRLLVQSILPKKIINAWTSPDCLGVSRHLDFTTQVCLACLYLPTIKAKSESVKIAEALNMPEHEVKVREYLAMNLPIDETFIAMASQANGINGEELKLYINKPVRILYSEGICGGRVLSLQSGQDVPQDMEVPLAHESAMAGVLLAAEVIIESLALRTKPIEPLTKINLMQPLHQYLREKEEKHYSGRCLCHDNIFQTRYRVKWSAAK